MSQKKHFRNKPEQRTYNLRNKLGKPTNISKISQRTTENNLCFINKMKKTTQIFHKYASPAERMLDAIGEPTIVDTKLDERLSRIYSNKIIKRYPAFHEFFGMEETIEQIVSFFKHAAQGLEEKKQIKS